jgi:hypothetical protein
MEKLVEGSKYIIRSIGGKDEMLVTHGEFVGYASIGKGDGGVCIKLDKLHEDMANKIRIIPLMMILSIDIVKSKKEEKKKKEVDNHYYR